MDKSIRIWNVNKKICIQVLNFHSDVIFCICSFKDRILSGGRDQEIVVWKYC
jgi:WD40 repeat protein